MCLVLQMNTIRKEVHMVLQMNIIGKVRNARSPGFLARTVCFSPREGSLNNIPGKSEYFSQCACCGKGISHNSATPMLFTLCIWSITNFTANLLTCIRSNGMKWFLSVMIISIHFYPASCKRRLKKGDVWCIVTLQKLVTLILNDSFFFLDFSWCYIIALLKRFSPSINCPLNRLACVHASVNFKQIT